MAYTLAQAQARLDAYLTAEAAVLQKQSYRIADRTLQLADLAEIRAGITQARADVVALEQRSAGMRRSRTVILRA